MAPVQDKPRNLDASSVWLARCALLSARITPVVGLSHDVSPVSEA